MNTELKKRLALLKKEIIRNPTPEILKEYSELLELRATGKRKMVDIPKEEREKLILIIKERLANKEKTKKISDELNIEYYSLNYYCKGIKELKQEKYRNNSI